MKKLLLSLTALLIVVQCNPNSSYARLMEPYHRIIEGRNVANLSGDTVNQFLNQLNQKVVDVTEQATKKSVNIFGKKDSALISSSEVLRDITIKAIKLYKTISSNNSYLKNNPKARSEFETELLRIKQVLNKELAKINKFHVASSKRIAQKDLKQVIHALRASILKQIETHLMSLR